MILKVKAYAKINLYLNINGITANGYHNLDSLMASVNLFDELTIKLLNTTTLNTKMPFNNENNIQVEFTNSNNVDCINNTAYKAAALFFEKYKYLTQNYLINIKIKKNIPIGAGLGGSSADGAGVLFALSNYFSVPYSDIQDIALRVGSDVPFMLKGGICKIKNLGELSSIENFKRLNILLIKPDSHVNTTECYKKFDILTENDLKNCNISGYCNDNNLLKKLNLEKIYNALTLAASLLNKDITILYNAILKQKPQAAIMTGSGSAVVGIFKTKKEALFVKEKLQTELLNTTCFVLTTVAKGCKF